MFDRTIMHTGPESMHITVKEQRAPTDESVRLLKELEEAARSKVEKSINVGGNGFECVIHTMRDAMDDSIKFAAFFALNGRRMEFREEIRSMDFGPEKVWARLVDGIAKRIAEEAVSKALPKNLFELKP